MNKYEREYHLERHSHLYDNEEYYLARARIAAEIFFKGIKHPNGRVLEFGCGLGQNIYFFGNSIGYDVSKFAIDFCKKKKINVTNNLKGLKDNSFDVVLSCEVLEHLEEPLKELKIMYSKLKKKGKLILILPIDKRNNSAFIPDLNQHLYCWNFRSINNLLLRAGFTPILNKKIRGKGYKRLLFLNKISFRLYVFVTWITAILWNSKHMKIVAIKNE